MNNEEEEAGQVNGESNEPTPPLDRQSRREPPDRPSQLAPWSSARRNMRRVVVKLASVSTKATPTRAPLPPSRVLG
jgi:hypothetical protein